MVKKNNALCLMVAQDLAKEISFEKDNILEIRSEYYHDCKITIKPDMTIEDRLGIYALKKQVKMPLVQLIRHPDGFGRLTLKGNDGKDVIKTKTKEQLSGDQSVWIGIQPATGSAENRFKLVVKKFDSLVTRQQVADAPPAPPYPLDNVASDDIDDIDDIIVMEKIDDGFPSFTEQYYEMVHNKIDDDKISQKIKVINSLHLLPRPSYPFPPGIQLMFGAIKTNDDETNVRYRVTIEEMMQITIATPDGKFVFFIDDEMVNNVKILNSNTKKYEFTLMITKIFVDKDGNTREVLLHRDSARRAIDPDFRVHNLGTFEGAGI